MFTMATCTSAGLIAPRWLAEEFCKRVERVRDAWEATWDGALGRPWPAHTVLQRVREKRRLRSLVHAAVFSMVQERPHAALSRTDVFADVGELRSINRSPGSVEKLYYEAVSEGALNVAQLRATNPTRSGELRGMQNVESTSTIDASFDDTSKEQTCVHQATEQTA